jgi:transposase
MKRTQGKARRPGPRLDTENLHLLEPEAAAIDVGSRSHWVAVNPERDAQPVREFGSFTADLHCLADWLVACGATSVVMESTGVYWMALFEVLESRGLEVRLVDAQTARHLPGRPKSDVRDCQWLRRLRAYGLLRRCFRPPAQICRLRSYLRSRSRMVEAAAQQILRMQKALTQMNVQLHHVISDLSGQTGLAIVEAIVAGERDPKKLAQYRNVRIAASPATIEKGLEGHWQPELIFDLQIALKTYQFFCQQVAAYDEQIAQELRTLDSKVDPEREPATKRRSYRLRQPRPAGPGLDLRTELYRVSGVDLTQIDGISVLTAQKVIFEIGPDVSAWADEKKFSSWLGLSPNHEISGGKVLKRRSRKVVHPLSVALRLAARSLRTSQSALGANFRRLIAKIGMPKAITALARKLAVLIYRMLKFGSAYLDKGMAYYEEKYQQSKLDYLQRQAAKLGLTLVSNPGVVVGVP